MVLSIAMLASMGSVFAEDVGSDGTWFTTYDNGVITNQFVPQSDQTTIEPQLVNSNGISTYTYEPALWTKVTNFSYSPYNAIVKLKCNYTNGTTGYGTGFVVANGRIVTTAHCLYKNREGIWISSIDVTFPNTGITVRTSNGTIPTGWMSTSGNQQEVALDYAILRVDSSYTNLSSKLGLSTNAYQAGTYSITGFPKHGQYDGNSMYTHSGQYEYDWYSGIQHSINSTVGLSGAPMYNSSNYVVGIQAYANHETGVPQGFAVRITQPIIDFLLYI